MENTPITLENTAIRITIQGDMHCCWTYTIKSTGHSYKVAEPVFEIAGMQHPAILKQLRQIGQPVYRANAYKEYRYEGIFSYNSDLALTLIFHLHDTNPTIRFSYILQSQSNHSLTKSHAYTVLSYFGVSFATLPKVKALHYRRPLELIEQIELSQSILGQAHFEDETQIRGPMIFGSNDPYTMLVAHEPALQISGLLLEYKLAADRSVTLLLKQGNYGEEQTADFAHPYKTPWFQMAAMKGTAEMLMKTYQAFVLRQESVK